MKVSLSTNKIVQVTSNHGGYLGAQCLSCNELGWLDGKYGYAHSAKGVMSNRLIHKKSCPMNKLALKKWEGCR